MLYTISAIGRAIAQSLELDDVLNSSLETVLKVLEIDAGTVLLL